MLTEERKQQIIADIEGVINDWLDKQGIIEEVKYNLFKSEEEYRFMKSIDGAFSIFKESER